MNCIKYVEKFEKWDGNESRDNNKILSNNKDVDFFIKEEGDYKGSKCSWGINRRNGWFIFVILFRIKLMIIFLFVYQDINNNFLY